MAHDLGGRSDAAISDLIPLPHPRLDALMNRIDMVLDEHETDPDATEAIKQCGSS